MATQLMISCLVATSATLLIGFLIHWVWIKTLEKNPKLAVHVPWAPFQIAICILGLVSWGWWVNNHISPLDPIVEWATGVYIVLILLGLSYINAFLRSKTKNIQKTP